MDFGLPNPVQRTDLPVRHRRWPWVLGGLVAALILLVLFLPFVLQSAVGRTALSAYLGSRFNAKVKIGKLQTGWFSPTRVEVLDFDLMGRHLRINSMVTDLSLWNLLRGRYHMGRTTIEGSFEYVINYGDDKDTFDSMLAGRKPRPPGTPVELPIVSGHITVEKVKIILTRIQIVPEDQYKPLVRSTTLLDVRGTIDIRSLDQPAQIDMTAGIDSPNPEDADGGLHLSGTLSLGSDGKLSATGAKGDLTLQALRIPNVPTATNTPLLWLFTPWLDPADIAVTFGPRLAAVDAHCTIGGGTATFDRFAITGENGSGITAVPAIDLSATPPAYVIQGGQNVISVPISRSLCRQYLVYLNPLLKDLSEAGGQVAISVDSMRVPMWGNWRTTTMRGQVQIDKARLASGTLGGEETIPNQLTTQWQALSGDLRPTVALKQPPTQFAVAESLVSLDSAAVLLDDIPLHLAGKIGLNGRLKMSADLSRAPAATQPAGLPSVLVVPLAGTIEQPKLGIATAIRSVVASVREEFLADVSMNLAHIRDRATEATFPMPPDPSAIQTRLKQLVQEAPPTTQP